MRQSRVKKVDTAVRRAVNKGVSEHALGQAMEDAID